MIFLFLIVLLAGLGYVLWHIWSVLPFALLWKWIAVGVCTLCFLTLFLNFSRTIEQMPLSVAKVCYEVGNSSIMILLYLMIIFLLLDLGRLVRLVPKNVVYDNVYTSLIITVAMVAVFVYGYVHYNNKVRQELRLRTEKRMGRNMKIALMSDLHVGYHNGRKELARWVDMVNAENADLILIGGDIVDISVRPLNIEKMSEEFRRLNAPVYACFGNHEYYSDEARVSKFYKESGITLLRDSVVTVGDLCIVGRDDRTNAHRKSLGALMKDVDRSKYVILLDHQPYHLEQAEKQGIDFQFSGHTHHGQVWPISWITEAIYEDAFRSLKRGNTEYYVSSGMGIWGGKFRIGTRSEYVVAYVGD